MHNFNAETDLKISRTIHASPETVWRCWSDPELLRRWIVPPPAKVTACEIDLAPGGVFSLEMEMTDGTRFPNAGCVLVAEHARRIITSDALLGGFRPSGQPFFTSDITLTGAGDGCQYDVHVMHTSSDARQKHLDMGFDRGWNTAISQLDDLAQSMAHTD